MIFTFGGVLVSPMVLKLVILIYAVTSCLSSFVYLLSFLYFRFAQAPTVRLGRIQLRRLRRSLYTVAISRLCAHDSRLYSFAEMFR